MTHQKRTVLLDADNREDVHNELAHLIDELEDNWTGPVRIDVTSWDSYTHKD